MKKIGLTAIATLPARAPGFMVRILLNEDDGSYVVRLFTRKQCHRIFEVSSWTAACNVAKDIARKRILS